MKTTEEQRVPVKSLQRGALVAWVLGTLCLPVGVFFDSEINWVLHNTGLFEPVRTFVRLFPVWLVIAAGPLLAIASALLISRNTSQRITFMAPPTVILFVSAAIAILTHLLFSGWPTD